jgi:hypothetical protein
MSGRQHGVASDLYHRRLSGPIFVDGRQASQWRHDRCEVGEIEIDDRLEGDVGRGVAEAVGQDIMPGGVVGLQREQLGDGVAPALRAAAPVGRSVIMDSG